MLAEPSALPMAPVRRSAVRFLLVVTLALVALGAGAANALALDVNVRSYNAVGDGTTNDRVAIQNAIDAVNAAGGGIVTVPSPGTYLTGNLILKSNVDLNIESGAILKQSQTLGDYANTPTKGREIPCPSPPCPYVTYLDQNYPLIYAGNASNVSVTGHGTIEMTWNGGDTTSIIVHAIGFHLVSNYTISDITISGASAYNLAMRNTDHGTISGVTTNAPHTLNSDGISLMNSSNLSVHGNNLTTKDDGIYVWASYQDPRKSAWWDSDTARPSRDIEIYGNTVNNLSTNGSHGFLFINWTGSLQDQSLAEISNINVHDNSFTATKPVSAIVDDIYHPKVENDPAHPEKATWGQKTPSKNLRFNNNTLTSQGGPLSTNLDAMATAELKTDNDTVYNFARASTANGMYNRNFDGQSAYPSEVGTSFWSVEGGASAPSTPVGQPGGRYGQIAGFNNGYAGIYQGVWLTPGTYSFTASTQSSGAAIRLFAIRATGTTVMASTTFTNTTWQTQTINFTVTTADTYRLGIDSAGAGSSSTAYGRIDSTVLTKTA